MYAKLVEIMFGLRQWRNNRVAFALVFLIGLALFSSASGIRASGPRRGPHQGGNQKAQHRSPQASPAQEALQQRVAAAEAARNSKDPQAIAQASTSLIALVLRQMGHLRLLQNSYGQAVSLYERSLTFEDLADTSVDLATAELQAHQVDRAIAETAKVLLRDPHNARAFNVQGKAWMKKRDFGRAAEALQKSVQIQPDFEAAYSLGICLLQSKQKEMAIAVFRQLVELEGESGSIHVLFGRAYRDAELMEDAIRELRRAVAIDPRTPHAHYFLGLAYLIQNEWAPTPEILHEFQVETQNNPRDFLSNYFLGVMASNAKHYSDSNRYLKIAEAVDSTWPETWLYRGLNASGEGDTKKAEELLRKAVELTGSDEARTNFQIRKAYIALGRILAASGRQAESEQFMERARDLQQKSLAVSQQKVASLAADSGVGMGAAIAPLEEAREDEKAGGFDMAQTDPSAPMDAAALSRASLTDAQKAAGVEQEKQLRTILGTAYNDLATSEAVSKNYARALNHYEEAERWDARIPGLMRNLGAAAYRLGNYTEAVRGLMGALAANPADHGARAMLGMAFFGTNGFAEAVRTIEPLGDAALRDPAVGYAWAASLVRLGETKEAEKILESVEKTILTPDTLVLLGQLRLSMKDYPQAIADLHRAAEQNPSLAKAHYYAGIAYIRSDRPEDAEAEFLQELRIHPSDIDAQYNLGFVYQQLTKMEQAAALFRQVVAVQPEHAEAQYQLGKILLDQDNAKEAIEHLEEAVRLSPNADYIHYQLQSAYRKDSRTDDADRELQIYKDLKARNRQATLPQSNENP